jgi:hypothetical protein
MAGITVVGFLISACATSSEPRHPGRESKVGKVLLFDKDQYGDWTTEKRYNNEQKQELRDYEDELRWGNSFPDEDD